MLSTPPATITSACPARMALAPVAMACKPEEQNRVRVWAQTLSEADIPLLYVAYPKKTPRTDNGLPPDLPDWPVLKMNALVQHMEERGVEVLDLRDSFEALGDYSHLFYRTDHHWNIEGGFFAFQTICETLRTEYGVEMDPWYEDASHYNWEVLENWFLGSQGKRVGTLFAGTDDFTVMTPDFATGFTFSIPSRETMREGTMEETPKRKKFLNNLKDFFD